MDAKITKVRLSRMLSYDWLKIIGTAAALILVWILIFTMTATRITAAQQFTVFNYTGNVSLSSTKFYDSYEKGFEDGIFSYEVIEINENDLTTGAEYATTLLESRLETDEGDVIFLSPEGNADYAYTDENGATAYKYTYLETFLLGYRWYLFDLDWESETGFFGQMRTYLDRYYDGGYESGVLNEAAVEADFRARIKKNKDKRYKKKSQIEKGIANDIERIKKYRDGLVEFKGYLDGGYVSLTRTQVASSENPEEWAIDGVYSLDLCPDAEKMGNLSDIAAYQKTYTNEEGNSQTVKTAENMNIAFFDLNGTEDGFAYESLLYVNYLVRTCKTA